MSDAQLIPMKLAESDLRYKLHAYFFVRDGLTYAQDVLPVGADEDEVESSPEPEREIHLTGQQL